MTLSRTPTTTVAHLMAREPLGTGASVPTAAVDGAGSEWTEWTVVHTVSGPDTLNIKLQDSEDGVSFADVPGKARNVPQDSGTTLTTIFVDHDNVRRHQRLLLEGAGGPPASVSARTQRFDTNTAAQAFDVVV